MSIGLALAHNAIDSSVVASIQDVASVGTSGAVVVTATSSSDITVTSRAVAVAVAISAVPSATVAASGGGSESTNIISSTTNAYVEGGALGTVAAPVGAVTITASSTGAIQAEVLAIAASVAAGAGTNVGVAIGIAVARNLIGYSQTTPSATYDNNARTTTLSNGETVQVARGPRIGDVYRYTGPSGKSIDLSVADFSDTSIWKQLGLNESGARVRAAVADASIDATGALTILATGEQSISAVVVAAAVAIAGGGLTNVGVSGAGVFTQNKIASVVEAYVDGDGATGITVASAALTATDASGIKALAGAAALSAAIGSATSIAVALGISIALNEVGIGVDASIRNADEGLTTTAGGVSVTANAVGRPLLTFGGMTVADFDDAATRDEDNLDTAVDEQAADADGDAELLLTLTDKLTGGYALSPSFKVVALRPGVAWQIIDASPGFVPRSFLLTYNGSEFQVSAPTIDAIAFAASVALSFGSTAGVSFSGAAAVAFNAVTSTANAHIDESKVTSKLGVSLKADSTSAINALVLGISAAVGASGEGGVGASIGVALSKNLVGYRLDGSSSPSQVQAYVLGSTITAQGALTATAAGSETIAALVIAGSVAVGASGGVGVGASGSGVSVDNKIRIDVRAYVDGDSATGVVATGISASAITLRATDASSIAATAVAVSIAGAFATGVGVAVSIGVSLAHNEISNQVEAYLKNATHSVSTGTGPISISASQTAGIRGVSAAASLAVAVGTLGFGISGAGAEATNVILTKTNAYIDASVVTSAGAVTLTATDTSHIAAIVVAASIAAAGGATAIGASIGASLARNLVGWTTDGTRTPAEVRAYLSNSSVAATGALSARATSSQTIEAIVVSGSVAVSGGGLGVGLSGAGSSTINKIAVRVEAAIDGDGSDGIEATGISLTASDVSTIKAGTGSGALAAGVGATGVAMTVGVSIARNEISNEVRAYIRNADTGVTTTDDGAISLSATEGASITANATAVSAAVSAGLTGVSFAGAGADARNVILTKTDAYIAGSTVTSDGAVTITATDTALTVSAEIVSVADAFAAAGGFSGGLAIGVGISQNFIGWDPSYPTSSTTTYTTDSTPASVSTGDDVRIADGPHGGYVYRYVSTTPLAGGTNGVLLRTQDYSDTSLWKQVRGLAEVKAYVSGSSLTAAGALTITATASETITALVNTDSVAVAGSAGGAVAAAGAGTSVINRIATVVLAYIASTPADKQVKASSIAISATDTATITATANAVAIAAAFGVTGAASAAVAVSLADNEISGSTEAFVSSADVATTSGAMSITATSTASNTGDAYALALSVSLSVLGIGLTGGGARVDTTTRTSTKAYVSSSTLDVAGELTVTADADATTTQATVHATSTAVGFLAFAFAVNPKTVVTLEPTVEASLHKSSVTAGGSIGLTAGAATTATAKTEGNAFAGGVIAVTGAGSDATATTRPTVKAYISGASSSTTSEGGSISVLALLGVSTANVRRGGDTRAEAQAASASAGFGGAGAGATASATNSGAVESSADGTLSASNAITIRGKAIRGATADARGTAGGLVGVGDSDAFATADGTAKALLSGSVVGATDLTIQAISTDAANASSRAVSGGLIADSDNESSATASPTLTAAIQSSGRIDIAGTLTLEASAYPEADASTRGVAGGLVGVGSSKSMTTVEPTVTASVTAPVSASPPTIHAGTIVVLAQATPQTDAVVPDFRIVSTNTTLDTLRILSSGLQTGEVVEYEPGANALIGGLVSTYVDTSLGGSVTLRRAYNILTVYTGGAVDPDNVALGNLFASGAIDASLDRITFATAHNFLPGDEVVYRRGQGSTTGVDGLTEGATYYVLVVDELTIELTTTKPAAVTPGLNLKSFNPSNVSANTINLTSNGFVSGQAVTYRAPASATFLGAQVAVAASFVGDPSELKLTPDAALHNIYFVSATTGAQLAHGFTDGETVNYHVSGGTAIGGLTDGEAYRVQLRSTYDIALRPITVSSLSLTFAQNGGSPDTITRGDGLSWATLGYAANMQVTIGGDTTSGSGTVNVNGTYTIVSVSGTALTVSGIGANRTFTGSATAASDIPITVTAAQRQSNAIHRLTRPTEEPISGLVDGRTYYVYRPAGMTSDNFQLVSTKTGTTPIPLVTSGLGAAVVHKIGAESVDIDALTCGAGVNCDQTLRINITGGSRARRGTST